LATRRKNIILGLAVLTMAIILIGIIFSPVHASWFINDRQYHASVHGRFSCLACHPDIQAGLHPDPAKVNQASAAFTVETCRPCHQNILGDLDQGRHDQYRADINENFNQCVKCHDPHTRIAAAAFEGFWENLDKTRPITAQCHLCHEKREALPPLTAQDQVCLDCHRAVNLEEPGAAAAISAFCLHCHGTGAGLPVAGPSVNIPRIDSTEPSSGTSHAGLSCLDCHPESARFNHGRQETRNCRSCHHPHPARVARDPHLNVACLACHLEEMTPVLDQTTGMVTFLKQDSPDRPGRIHNLLAEPDEQSCKRCHTQGNKVGAAVWVLPSKSVICLPCHAATVSANDPISLLSLLIFVIGLIMAGSVWFSGGLAGKDHQTDRKKAPSVFARLFAAVKALIFDALLNRRLFIYSPARWTIHALIFFPIVFRFGWGLIGLLTSHLFPGREFTWILLNDYHPLTALVFDLSGVMIIVGVCLAMGRKLFLRSPALLNLPKTDFPALILLGGMIFLGFILEGLRIAMSGPMPGAPYAFIGFALSRLWSGESLTLIYVPIWLMHALFVGAFAAYLPFSRMFHLLLAPIVLAAKTWRGGGTARP